MTRPRPDPALRTIDHLLNLTPPNSAGSTSPANWGGQAVLTPVQLDTLVGIGNDRDRAALGVGALGPWFGEFGEPLRAVSSTVSGLTAILLSLGSYPVL